MDGADIIQYKYQSLFSNQLDAVYELDVRGHFLALNESCLSMWGYPKEELLETSFENLIFSEDLQVLRENLKKVSQGNTSRFTIRCISKKGQFIYLDVTNFPILIDGDIVGIYGIAKDMTDRIKTEQELQRRTALLEIAERIANLGRWYIQVDTRKIIWSDQIYEIFAVKKDKFNVSFDTILPFIHPDDLENARQITKKALQGQEKNVNLICRIIRNDGEILTLHTSGTIIYDHVGQPIEVLGTIQNITTVARLQESEKRLSRVVEAASAFIAIFERTGKLVYLNASARKCFGIDPNQDIQDAVVFDYMTSDSLLKLRNIVFPHALEHGNWLGELEMQTVKGEKIPVFVIYQIDKFPNGEVECVTVIASDITVEKQLTERIKHQAYFDDVTGLPNRSFFYEKLNTCLANTSVQQQAVMFIDLDEFKRVNDTFGHSYGDAILRDVAIRISRCLNSSSVLARWGGDEFTVLSKNIKSIATLTESADMIVAAMAEPFFINGKEIYLTPSIGISVFPEDGDNAEILVQHADVAMYQAKKNGKNQYIFYSSVYEQPLHEMMSLEGYLRRALSKNELRVFYQPKIQISNQKIIGVEALIRWDHPKLGIISPNQFIPLAEETGLIVPIGEWILRESCKQIVLWNKSGYNLDLAVNVSPRQIQRSDFSTIVMDVLKETQFPPERLELEITESAVVQDESTVSEALRKLRELGVKISLDDFGTGYSSLVYLRRLAINNIKIDRSFVKNINIEIDDTAITQTVIDLGHRLRMKVIAEGVESEDQLHFLEQCGCDEIQGFLFSPPLPSHDFEKLFYEKQKH